MDIENNKPTHGAMLLYALSVYFFYYGVHAAASDILGTSPNASGLFPTTTSNYDISTEPYTAGNGDEEKSAQSDMELLMSSGDDDIAEAYGRASTESADE